jgi:hypothetical protein
MKADSRSESEVRVNRAAVPAVVDRATFQAQMDALRVREKAHTREGDAIAATRRRLPMVEVDGAARLVGPRGPVTLLDAFEGRRQLIGYYFMWHTGKPAAEQCEGCTLYNGQVRELSFLHSRDVTYATFCQGPYEDSVRYRDFMGGDMQVLGAGLLGGAAGGAAAKPLLPRVLHAPRRACVRDLLDERPRRGGDGQQQRATGPDRLRASGGMGGLALRLASELEHRRPPSLPHQGTPDRSVAAARLGALRRARSAMR